MTVIALDPRSALVVIDLQKGTVANPFVHPIREVVDRALDLVAAFRGASRPVVLVNAASMPPGRTEYAPRELPAGWDELIPELHPQPDDILVTKAGWGAFTGTDLHERLTAAEVNEVVIVGVATSFGVESTARTAYDLGYDVVLAIDAMTDMSIESDQHRLDWVFPALGQSGTTAEIADLVRPE